MTARDELLALATRLEAATGPDRDLDEDIAVMLRRTVGDEPPPLYTASLDTALSLVPANASEWSASWYKGQAASAEIVIDSVHSGDSATPALALAAAALRARAATLATTETDHG